jgi:hypothetical protein
MLSASTWGRVTPAFTINGATSIPAALARSYAYRDSVPAELGTAPNRLGPDLYTLPAIFALGESIAALDNFGDQEWPIITTCIAALSTISKAGAAKGVSEQHG